MDLNPLGSLSHFDAFDDDVSKESNDLTVDAGLSNEGPFLSSVSVAGQDLSQSLSIVPSASEVQEQQPSEVGKRKGGWTKGKKRGKKMGVLKDLNAPKQPLSGYMRYVAERREQMRVDQPNLSFIEINKQLGGEWTALPMHDKQRYIDEAEREREKYLKDLEVYQKTDSYKLFRQQFEKKTKEVSAASSHVPAIMRRGGNRLPAEEEESRTFDIPIFTEEFLDHNKGTGELPTLETIDSYMARLHSLILDSPQENETLIATVREIVGRLNVELDPSKVR
ncbi:high mobility group protein 20A [Elysia marginata]|uniref:High mobility group protein 20A n=1 Tax=Elysia marginata TaxID=1093978 RepID=A0AAV4IGX3_9GAST|nr:high mobility group protein 20A [Elysia marginata]